MGVVEFNHNPAKFYSPKMEREKRQNSLSFPDHSPHPWEPHWKVLHQWPQGILYYKAILY